MAAAAAIVIVIVLGDAIAECRPPAREHHNDVDNHDQSKDAEQGELDPLPHHLVLDGLPARGIMGGSKKVNAVMLNNSKNSSSKINKINSLLRIVQT